MRALASGLSQRLFWFTVLTVLLIEVLAFLPALGRARHGWLAHRIAEAQLAALSAAPVDADESRARDALLRRLGIESIRLVGGGGDRVVLPPLDEPPATRTVDPQRETSLTSIHRALTALLPGTPSSLRVTAATPLPQGPTLELAVDEGALRRNLLTFTRQLAGAGIVIAIVTGALLYFALLFLLVRPLHRITDSIAEFRADPERATPLDPRQVSLLSNDEMAVASEELAALQHELRSALGRNARLASLGASLAKVNHDLRNILSPVQLMGDRLEMHADPSVQRAGKIVTRGVEMATELARSTLQFARDGVPPPPTLAAVSLAPLIDETVIALRTEFPGFTVRNTVPQGLAVQADPDRLARIFFNLLRNAAQAGARTAATGVDCSPNTASILVSDTGPGLPKSVQDHLFRPFVTGTNPGSSGLGLAIAHDLARAQGGTLELAETSSTGTCFRLNLPLPPEPPMLRG